MQATGRLWIKICGNTNLHDAQTAVDAGADALGFVCAPSPREVTPAQVAAITAHLPAHVESYGVFVNPSFAEVVATVESAGLTGIQLHTSTDPTLPAKLRDHFAPRGIPLLHALHYTADRELFRPRLQALQGDLSIHAILVDSRSAVAEGGTGLRFDWEEARTAFSGTASSSRMIVAGGLSPENVAQAIATLQPWGVDVVTGVEASPGIKNPERVRAFITRARQVFSPN